MMITVGKYEIDVERFHEPKEHFWLIVENGLARIGMDPLVREAMGALVVVQLEPVGMTLGKGDSFGTIEAEKYVGPLRSPISGVIRTINQQVIQNPLLASTDPYGQGWFIEMEPGNFEAEKGGLLIGEEVLRTWFEEEIRRHQEEGWLAEP